MLSKEDINTSAMLSKGRPKGNFHKIKPNASNYVSKATNLKKNNYSTAIENLVNQALKSQVVNSEGIRIRKKVKEKNKQKIFNMNNSEYHSFDNSLMKKSNIVTTKVTSKHKS
mmetsp:Transcript_25471/g.22633  ORF Transcript_25471/g.22633 Transcript_25471/m.22633 type:complete len:113 (-) Transcript_25471:70-408(-)